MQATVEMPARTSTLANCDIDDRDGVTSAEGIFPDANFCDAAMIHNVQHTLRLLECVLSLRLRSGAVLRIVEALKGSSRGQSAGCVGASGLETGLTPRLP